MPSDNEYLAEFVRVCAKGYADHGLACDPLSSNMLLAYIFGKAFLAVLEMRHSGKVRGDR
jgi:hypothetical protein